VTTALVRREVHFVAILSPVFENAAGFKIRPGGDRGFESCSLQRRVCRFAVGEKIELTPGELHETCAV
jgi:hypothetical protein